MKILKAIAAGLFVAYFLLMIAICWLFPYVAG